MEKKSKLMDIHFFKNASKMCQKCVNVRKSSFGVSRWVLIRFSNFLAIIVSLIIIYRTVWVRRVTFTSFTFQKLKKWKCSLFNFFKVKMWKSSHYWCLVLKVLTRGNIKVQKVCKSVENSWSCIMSKRGKKWVNA